MVTYTTTDFVEAVKRTAHVPTGNSTFTSNDILAMGDMQMRTGVAPKIASCRENYWLTNSYQDINGDNIYPIPSKAQANGIVDVQVKNGTNLIHLSRLEVSDLYSLQFSTRPAYCYYIEDYKLRLNPTTLSGQVVIWYYRIPSKLVAVTACAQITAIDFNTETVTVSTVPSTFVGGGELDIASQTPGFSVLLKDSEPVSIVGNDITFTEVPNQVAVGDWVCLSGQSCVVQCPLEWIEVLVQRTAVKIYEIQGYDKKHKMAKDIQDQMEQAAMGLVSPRTIESAKVISGGGSLLYPQTRGWKLPVR